MHRRSYRIKGIWTMSEEQLQIYESYLNKGFNEEQLYEIRKGIEDGIDVSEYAVPGASASAMAHIRKTINFNRSLKKISNDHTDQVEEVNESEEIEIDIRTKHEKMADRAILIGETSIVIAILALLLIMLRII